VHLVLLREPARSRVLLPASRVLPASRSRAAVTVMMWGIASEGGAIPASLLAKASVWIGEARCRAVHAGPGSTACEEEEEEEEEEVVVEEVKRIGRRMKGYTTRA